MGFSARRLLDQFRRNTLAHFPRSLSTPILRLAYAFKRLKGLARWTVPALTTAVLPLKPGDRRMLLIYDFSSQPYAIGDILALQEASLVLLEKHELNTVDFAFVYDPESPVDDRDHPTYNSITPENVSYHLGSLFPVAQINEHLGSLFVFNSHSQLERFVADNSDRYCIWPSAGHYAGREYLYYTVVNELLYEHYKKHKTIPHLTCRPLLVEWARSFYRRLTPERVPITVQIRKNDTWAANRNLHLDSWLQFFDHCESRYPATFVITCAVSEVDERLRQFPNILIAKDHHTGIEQDLALIQAAAFHMGAGSGPACMVIFSAKPYLLVNTDMMPHLWKDMTEEDNFIRFYFSGPLQGLSRDRETSQFLIQEFAKRWNSIDLTAWLSAGAGQAETFSKPLTWLR